MIQFSFSAVLEDPAGGKTCADSHVIPLEPPGGKQEQLEPEPVGKPTRTDTTLERESDSSTTSQARELATRSSLWLSGAVISKLSHTPEVLAVPQADLP